MARPTMCSAEDGQPAAYLITDTDTGDTFAPCVAHWIDLCMQVAGSQAAAAAEAESDDSAAGAAAIIAEHAVSPEVAAAMADDAAGVTVELGDAGEPMPADSSEPGQRRRTRAKLAERPDSAATSEAVVPWPDLGKHSAE